MSSSENRQAIIAPLRHMKEEIDGIVLDAQREVDKQKREDLVERANRMTGHLRNVMQALNLENSEITQILRD